MIRRFFTILSALSLLLCLATAVLFVRSFWVGEGRIRFHWDGVTTKATVVVSSNGRVWCGRGRTQSTDPEWIATREAMAKSGMMEHWGRGSGQAGDSQAWYKLSYLSGSGRGFPMALMQSSTTIAIPEWPILLVLAVLPGLWLIAFRRLRRSHTLGLCRKCNYDLRAHTPGQLCPECGLAIPADLVRKPIA